MTDGSGSHSDLAPQVTSEVKILPAPEILQRMTEWMNRLPEAVRRCQFVICDPEDPDFQRIAADIEQRAYEAEGAAQAAESEAAKGVLFEDHLRGVEGHGPIVYLGIKTPKSPKLAAKLGVPPDKLVAFFSIFQEPGFIFPECEEGWKVAKETEQVQVDGEPPHLVFSKLVRDPDPIYRRYLVMTGASHRILLSMTMFSFATQNENGALFETRAQPPTQRLLRPEVVRRYFPGYQFLYPPDLYGEEGRLAQEANEPRSVLFYIPHQRTRDLLDIARTAIKPRRKARR